MRLDYWIPLLSVLCLRAGYCTELFFILVQSNFSNAEKNCEGNGGHMAEVMEARIIFQKCTVPVDKTWIYLKEGDRNIFHIISSGCYFISNSIGHAAISPHIIKAKEDSNMGTIYDCISWCYESLNGTYFFRMGFFTGRYCTCFNTSTQLEVAYSRTDDEVCQNVSSQVNHTKVYSIQLKRETSRLGLTLKNGTYRTLISANEINPSFCLYNTSRSKINIREKHRLLCHNQHGVYSVKIISSVVGSPENMSKYIIDGTGEASETKREEGIPFISNNPIGQERNQQTYFDVNDYMVYVYLALAFVIAGLTGITILIIRIRKRSQDIQKLHHNINPSVGNKISLQMDSLPKRST